jgi:hypothetical protein
MILFTTEAQRVFLVLFTRSCNSECENDYRRGFSLPWLNKNLCASVVKTKKAAMRRPLHQQMMAGLIARYG